MCFMSKMFFFCFYNGFVFEVFVFFQLLIVVLGVIFEDLVEYVVKFGFLVELGYQLVEDVVINGMNDFVYWCKSVMYKFLVVVFDRIFDFVNLGVILCSVGFFGVVVVVIINYGGIKIMFVVLKVLVGVVEEVIIFGINFLFEFFNVLRVNGWEVYVVVVQELGVIR